MSVEIDTASDHVDLYDRLITFLQSGTPGPDWSLLRMDTGALSALFEAPGPAEDESIFMGFSLHAHPSDDAYSIGMWMFRAYDAGLDDLVQPGMSGVVYLPVYNTAMPYWFVANKHRLMIATKISTTYSSSYIGKFLPYGLPGEYPQPYYVSAPVSASNTRWSTVNEGDRSFFDPGAASKVLTPSGLWKTVQNFREFSGESDSSANNVWPFQGLAFSSTSVKARFRELRENTDGTYWTMPLILHGVDPDSDTYGELDGAYATTGFNSATENTLTIDGESYLVLQNMHRTASYYYAAIKLD